MVILATPTKPLQDPSVWPFLLGMKHFAGMLDIAQTVESEFANIDAAQAMRALRDILPDGTAAVVLCPWRGRPVEACIDPQPWNAPAEQSFRVAFRLLAWTAHATIPRAPRVPEYLRSWLPFDRAVVVPMDSDMRRFGALVVDSAIIDRGRFEAMCVLADELADCCARADRMAALSRIASDVLASPGAAH
jgi:hypothetical protein